MDKISFLFVYSRKLIFNAHSTINATENRTKFAYIKKKL